MSCALQTYHAGVRNESTKVMVLLIEALYNSEQCHPCVIVCLWLVFDIPRFLWDRARLSE